tara:strand:+ start:1105 stop:1275 length:171 start_codon:yes stop_codon:yes gene_type:complete
MKYVLAAVVAFSTIYLGFAFIGAEINPFNWPEEGRFFLVMCWSLVIAILIVEGEKK